LWDSLPLIVVLHAVGLLATMPPHQSITTCYTSCRQHEEYAEATLDLTTGTLIKAPDVHDLNIHASGGECKARHYGGKQAGHIAPFRTVP
jgi:hypothetical protein